MAHRFYDTTRWKSLRGYILAEGPLCVDCEAKGLTTIATEVDHIIPISEGGDATRRTNLQPLCASCHSKKTRIENQPAKTIDTQLGYADKVITEKVITKKRAGGRFQRDTDNVDDAN